MGVGTVGGAATFSHECRKECGKQPVCREEETRNRQEAGGGGGCVGQVGATKRPCCPSETQLCLLQLDSGVPGGPHNKFMLICPNVVRFLVFAINLIAKYDSAREAT